MSVYPMDLKKAAGIMLCRASNRSPLVVGKDAGRRVDQHRRF
jgi:hypothetical protein